MVLLMYYENYVSGPIHGCNFKVISSFLLVPSLQFKIKYDGFLINDWLTINLYFYFEIRILQHYCYNSMVV